MTPAQVHALGQAEVGRIEARYQSDVLGALDFGGSFADFVASCQAPDSGHYFANQADLLEGYRQLCDQIREQLPKFVLNEHRTAL